MVYCSKDDDAKPKLEDNETTIVFQDQMDIADDMYTLYEDLLLQNTPEKSRVLLVENLRKIDQINDAGISEDGTTVYWEYSDGLEYYFITETSLTFDSAKRTAGKSSGQRLLKSDNPVIPENKNALVLAPFLYQWSFLEYLDETDEIATMLGDNDYNVNYKANAESSQNNISLEDWKQFNNYSVIAISTHGAITKTGEIFINSGIQPTADFKIKYKDDIDARRLGAVTTYDGAFPFGRKMIALKTSWFDHEYDTKLNQTLVYMGACKGSYNEGLSNALIGSESAFFGWNENVAAYASAPNGIALFENLFEGKTVKEAYDQVDENGTTEYVSLTGLSKARFKLSSNSFNDLALNAVETYKLERVSSHHQLGIGGQELEAPLTVKVVNSTGDPVENQKIRWEITSGNGSLLSSETYSNSEGESYNYWTIEDNTLYTNTSACGRISQGVNAFLINEDNTESSPVDFIADKGFVNVKFNWHWTCTSWPSATVNFIIGNTNHTMTLDPNNCDSYSSSFGFAIPNLDQPFEGEMSFNTSAPNAFLFFSFNMEGGNISLSGDEMSNSTCSHMLYSNGNNWKDKTIKLTFRD
jgi:hypothetical protein